MKRALLRLSLLVFVVANFSCAQSTQQNQSSPQSWLQERNGELQATGEIKEFSLEGKSSGPTTVTVADDGTLWFTLSAGNAIGSMKPDGSDLKIYPLPHPDSSPRIIAMGSDGNIWFSEHLGNRIGKITPAGVISEYDIPTPNSQPRAIALSADGNIWFGMFAAGKIGRITPEGVITEFQIPTPNAGPRALAAGADGNVWFSEFYAGKIGRITPDGKITEFDLPRKNAGPGDITAGADGALWFLELAGSMDNFQTDGNKVARITVTGDITEFDIPSEGPSAINLAVGPDNNIWFTKGGSLWRVTPNGEMKEFPVTQPARTVGVSAGSDRQPPEKLVNRLWYTEPQGNKIGYLIFE